MTHLYILDLDRTSFNTQRFARDLITFVERTFQLDAAQFEQQIEQFVLPGEIGYDFYAHATAVTGRSQADIQALVTKHFNGADYTYPDVEPWLNARRAGDQVLIVTVGETRYQSLKLTLAPPLSGLRHQIVSKNKGQLLRETLAKRGVGEHTAITLIDDNPHTFTRLGPAPAVEQICLARPGEKFTGQPTPSHVTTIASLKDLP